MKNVCRRRKTVPSYPRCRGGGQKVLMEMTLCIYGNTPLEPGYLAGERVLMEICAVAFNATALKFVFMPAF